MKYGRAFLTYNEQADPLISRSLMVDREELFGKLMCVGYYRFSGHLYAYRQPDDTYRVGTTPDKAWDRLARAPRGQQTQDVQHAHRAQQHARDHRTGHLTEVAPTRSHGREPLERRAAELDKGTRPAALPRPMSALVAAAHASYQDLVHVLPHRRVRAAELLFTGVAVAELAVGDTAHNAIRIEMGEVNIRDKYRAGVSSVWRQPLITARRTRAHAKAPVISVNTQQMNWRF